MGGAASLSSRRGARRGPKACMAMAPRRSLIASRWLRRASDCVFLFGKSEKSEYGVSPIENQRGFQPQVGRVGRWAWFKTGGGRIPLLEEAGKHLSRRT